MTIAGHGSLSEFTDGYQGVVADNCDDCFGVCRCGPNRLEMCQLDHNH